MSKASARVFLHHSDENLLAGEIFLHSHVEDLKDKNVYFFSEKRSRNSFAFDPTDGRFEEATRWVLLR